tara:strand:- start:1542 stop:1760 length:219 start_codon:yes stop_codon:yes gene_type:complete
MSKDLAVEQMTFYDRMVDTLVDFMGGEEEDSEVVDDAHAIATGLFQELDIKAVEEKQSKITGKKKVLFTITI